MTSSWWKIATSGVRASATQWFQFPARPSRSELTSIRARSPATARTTAERIVVRTIVRDDQIERDVLLGEDAADRLGEMGARRYRWGWRRSGPDRTFRVRRPRAGIPRISLSLGRHLRSTGASPRCRGPRSARRSRRTGRRKCRYSPCRRASGRGGSTSGRGSVRRSTRRGSRRTGTAADRMIGQAIDATIGPGHFEDLVGLEGSDIAGRVGHHFASNPWSRPRGSCPDGYRS